MVTLSDANGMIDRQTAIPGGLVTFKLDQSKNKLFQTEQAKKGFQLTATAPVAVYQFHPIDAAQVFSGSATLLLPEHVMAKNYFVMSYTYNSEILTTPPQGQGFLAVMGLADGTDVEIKVPVATQGLPSLNTITGEIVDCARLPGSILLPRLEAREPQSKLPSELFNRKPVPGATTCAPNESDRV